MVSNTVNKIILAEKQAEDNFESARKKAEQIVYEANTEGENLIEEARIIAEKEADAIIQKNRQQIESILNSNKKADMERTVEIQKTAQEKIGQAIEIVIAKLIPKK